MQKKLIILCFLFIINCEDSKDDAPVTVEKGVILETLTEGLANPWGLAFLTDGSILITERPGKLRHYINGALKDISGLPDIIASGQGGLLDIQTHPNFENNQRIYFTATVGSRSAFSTALFSAEFLSGQLENVNQLFQADIKNSNNKHFGSRIVIDNKGYLFVSLGERDNPSSAQDLSNHNGTIVRLTEAGEIPTDNPFISTPNTKPEIWSYGHRNIQGMTLHPLTGELWSHEHGPRGGDEINIIKKGANYGWPLATFGVDYDGSIISNKTSIPGAEDPLYYWVPSIAPCGMGFYHSDTIPQWKGSVFLGALAGKHLNRITAENNKVISEERLYQNVGRFRHVTQGPDGYLYFITESPGRLYRARPSK
jgi:glucose/arabinose dehydrogenase